MQSEFIGARHGDSAAFTPAASPFQSASPVVIHYAANGLDYDAVHIAPNSLPFQCMTILHYYMYYGDHEGQALLEAGLQAPASVTQRLVCVAEQLGGFLVGGLLIALAVAFLVVVFVAAASRIVRRSIRYYNTRRASKKIKKTQ